MRGELDEPIAVYLKGKLQPVKPDRLNKGAKLHEDGDGADLLKKRHKQDAEGRHPRYVEVATDQTSICPDKSAPDKPRYKTPAKVP